MNGHPLFVPLLVVLLLSSALQVAAGPGGTEDRAAGEWTRSSDGLPTSGTFFGTVFGDVDNDGELDIVAASDGGGVQVYLGDGTGKWSAVGSHPATSGGYGGLALGDYDGDGNGDIFAGSPGNSNGNPKGIHVWRGDGEGGFTDVTSGSGLPTNGNWRGVDVGDIDGDGELDVAATNGYGSSQGIAVYVGDGRGGFESQSTGLPDDQERDSNVVLADFDGDGDLDLAAGGAAGVDVYLVNKGPMGNLAWSRSSVGLPDARMSGVTGSDWNKDGLLDLVVSAYGAGNGVGVHAYENGRNGALWTSRSEGLPTSGDFIENAVGDLNGDGNLDIATAGSYGGTYGIRLYHGDGQGSWSSNDGGLPDNVQYVGVDLGDVDGDGNLDIVAGKRSRGGGIEVWKNPASAPPPPEPLLTLTSMVGGESLSGGSQHPVEWTVTSGTPPYNVVVTYSVDGGETFPQTIASGVIQASEGEGGTPWTVPDLDSDGVRVRVRVTDAADMTVSRASPADLEVDSTAPTVSNTFPRDGATGVSTTTPVIITFDEGMDHASSDAVGVEGPGSPDLSSPAWSGTQLTLQAEGLSAGSVYTVTVPADARDDSDPGNAMAASHRFSFTTGEGSTPAPPIVDSTTPAHDGRGVSILSDVVVSFSKRMEQGATEGAVSVQPDLRWTAKWSPDGTRLSMDPDQGLTPNTRYTVTVGTAAMATDGTSLDSQYRFSFTTGDPPDLTPPTVLSTYPPDKQREVDPLTTAVTITFSEAMARAPTELALEVTGGTPSALEWSEGDTTLTLVMDLRAGTRYTVTVGTGARDPAGNGLPEALSFVFVTREDPTREGDAALGVPWLPLLLLAMVLVAVPAVRTRARGG